jgi:hypothetical protein
LQWEIVEVQKQGTGLPKKILKWKGKIKPNMGSLQIVDACSMQDTHGLRYHYNDEDDDNGDDEHDDDDDDVDDDDYDDGDDNDDDEDDDDDDDADDDDDDE